MRDHLSGVDMHRVGEHHTLGYHLPAGSYVRDGTFRSLVPDELRLTPFVTTAADIHPATRHEQNQAA